MGDHGADRRFTVCAGYGDCISLTGYLSKNLCPFINYVSAIFEVIKNGAVLWYGRGINHHHPVALGRIGKQCGQCIYIIVIDDIAAFLLQCSGKGAFRSVITAHTVPCCQEITSQGAHSYASYTEEIYAFYVCQFSHPVSYTHLTLPTNREV